MQEPLTTGSLCLQLYLYLLIHSYLYLCALVFVFSFNIVLHQKGAEQSFIAMIPVWEASVGCCSNCICFKRSLAQRAISVGNYTCICICICIYVNLYLYMYLYMFITCRKKSPGQLPSAGNCFLITLLLAPACMSLVQLAGW